MSYDEGTTSPLKNLLNFLIVGVLGICFWNTLVWLIFRHFGWGYVPVSPWTFTLGWIIALAFFAPLCFSLHQQLPPEAIMGSTALLFYPYPHAWLWSLITIPAMMLFLRVFPKTEE